MKKILFAFTATILLFSSCKLFVETPEIGLLLEKRFKNKLYKDFDTAAYNQVFAKHLDSISKGLPNAAVLKSFYQAKNQNPDWVTRFYFNGELDSLQNYISRSKAHGYNPAIFENEKLKALLESLTVNKFKSILDVYPVVADLELTAASSAIKYYNFVNFGSLNPRKIFTRYFIPVKRPDSTSTRSVLETKSILGLIKQIQPTSEAYTVLQKALASYEVMPSKDQAIKTVLVNMERQRWKLPELGEEYIEVNIPDFSLTWFNKKDTLSHMNVCVGGKREDD
ncbi:MAG TPA: L,D-transpeptidase, partial [Pedobacter sp.]